MFKFILLLSVFCFGNFLISKAQTHNGDPAWGGEGGWILIQFNIDGSDNTYCNSNVKDDFKFCISAHNLLTNTTISIGSMDMNGNDTQSSFDVIDAANGLTEGNGCDLRLDVGVGNGSTCGQVYLMFASWALSEDWSEAVYSLKITIKRVSNGDIWEKEYKPGTWNGAPDVAVFEGSTPTLQISVPDIAANICEGSILNVSTVATVSNADASGPYTITLADGGGANTFNPSYASVSGDNIQIAANCPAGNYTVKATVTDAANNTAETTFSFVVNAKPNIAITANPGATICKNDALTLSITDANNVANQYAWDVVGISTDGNLPSHNAFNASNVTYTAAPTGTMTYQAIAKSVAGCVDTAELRVTVNEAPVANLTASALEVCTGETITLTVTEANGSTTTADSWEWVNPTVATTTNTVTVTPTNTGKITYSVKSVKGSCKSTDFTTSVQVNPKPVLSVTNQPTPQCEGTQVDLASATLGGSAGLNLAYYSDANCTVTATNLQTVAWADSPKSFWVVGKNATTGCSDTVELKATVNQSPAKPTISGPTEVCEGGVATLSVTGVPGATYKWYSAGSQVGTGTSYTTSALTAAASYTVEVEVAGCKTMSDIYNIQISDKPAVTIPAIADVCAGTNVDLTASVSGGAVPYRNYVWTLKSEAGGEVLAVVQNDSTKAKATLGKGVNTFTLTVTDAKGCTGTVSVSANGGYIQNPLLTANPNPFIAGSSSSLTLTAGGSGVRGAGNIVDYDFSRLNPVPAHLGNTTATTYNPPIPTAPTKYQVVMTTEKGCKDSTEVNVQYSARDLAWNADELKGDTVCLANLSEGAVLRAGAVFGVTPYTYVWNIPAAAGVLSQTVTGDSVVLAFDATSATPGIHQVEVELTDANGKQITNKVNLIIGATPDVKINGDAAADLKVCLNSTLNLTASTSLTEGVSYLWKEPTTLASPTNATQSVSTATVNTTGTTYKVVATSVYGCVDSAARKVIVNDLPTITLTVDKDTVCPGTQAVARVTDFVSSDYYSWTGGGEGKQLTKTINVATKFEVQREDANGCIAKADTTVQVYVPAELILSEDQTVCSTPVPNLTLTASGLKEYSWSAVPSDAALVMNAVTQQVSPTVTTTYYVDGVDVHGCTVERDSIVVKVDQMPTFSMNEHILAACGSVDLYSALTVSPGATVKYGTTANFTGGTVISASSSTISTSGKYYVRAENGVCKSEEDTVRVNVLTAPQLRLKASAIEVCEGDSVNLADNVDWTTTTFDPVNLSYWDGDPAASGTRLTSTKVYPGVDTKTYYVQGTSTGCTPEKAPVTVTVYPKPVLAISASDTAVCTAAVDLSAAVIAIEGVAVNKTYFSDAAYTNAVGASVNTSGTYYVIGETEAGCRDSIEVTVRIKPHPAVTLTPSANAVCKEETVSLIVDGGAASDTYSWTVDGTAVSATTNTFTSSALTSSTTIGVTVTNVEGCTTELNREIIVHTPVVTLAANGDCQGESVTITATLTGGTAASYTWTGATQSGVANEATLMLTSAGQNVNLEVRTNDGCVVRVDSVFTGRVCDMLIVQVPDTTICSTGENVILTAHASGGTVTAWDWKQIAGPTTVVPTFTNAVLTVPTAGLTIGATYRFEVSVNGGVAKDTADLTVLQGVTITSLAALDSCSKNVIVEVIADNATSYAWKALSGAMGFNVPGDANKYQLQVSGNEYKVAVTASNGVCEASDTLSGRILNIDLNLAFRGNDTCGTNIQLPLSCTVNGVHGSVVAKYTYQSYSGTLTEDSIRFTPPTMPVMTAAAPGIYILTSVYATDARACAVTLNDTMKVGSWAEVELDDNCLALHKDSTFNLNIANSGDFDYIWSALESTDGVTWTAGAPGDGTTATTINGTMGDKDLQYVITATDQNLAQCKVSDTVHIYRIPDAPLVDIDTIGDRYHAQVIWSTLILADGYTVWSRKWDPYCLTTAYTGDSVYHAEPTGTNIPDTFWAEPNMDSLKFFYVTADINVCGSWYNSLPSIDTVGYKLDSLFVNPVQGRNNLNLISWMFDMKSIQTSVELFDRISTEYVDAIYSWMFATQGFGDYIVVNDLFEFGIGDRYDKTFDDLVVGTAYQYNVIKNTALLQYGRLMPIEYELKQPAPLSGVSLTNLNLIMLSPLRSYLHHSDLMLDKLGPTNSQALYYWNFESQGFSNYTIVNDLFEFGIGDKYEGVVKIYPGLPISLDYLNSSQTTKW